MILDNNKVTRRKILSWLYTKFTIEPEKFYFDITISNELGFDRELIDIKLKQLHKEKLVELDSITPLGTLYRISSKGIQEYKTTYNLSWSIDQSIKKISEKNYPSKQITTSLQNQDLSEFSKLIGSNQIIDEDFNKIQQNLKNDCL